MEVNHLYFSYGEKEIDYLKSKDKKLAAVIDRIGHIDRKVDDDPDAAGKDESRDILDPAGRFVLEHQRSFLHRLYSLWVNPITLQ